MHNTTGDHQQRRGQQVTIPPSQENRSELSNALLLPLRFLNKRAFCAVFAPSCPVTNCASSLSLQRRAASSHSLCLVDATSTRGKYTTTTVASTPRPPRSTLSAVIHCLFRLAVVLYIAEALEIRLVAGCSFCFGRYVRPFYICVTRSAATRGRFRPGDHQTKRGDRRSTIARFLTSRGSRGRSVVFP